MSLTIASNPPTEFAAGDTVTFTVPQGDYASADGWALTYYVLGAGIASVAATVSNSDWLITLPMAATAEFAAGAYRQSLIATSSTERRTTFDAPLRLTPNLATVKALDLQTHAERMVTLLETVSEGNATQAMKMYMIAGRQVQTLGPDELLKWLTFYRNEVKRQANGGRLMPIIVGNARLTPAFTVWTP